MNAGLAGKRRFIVVLGVLTGLAAVTVDMSLPAIPGMVLELATTMSLGQQIVAWFMAGIAVGQLPAGLVSDRIGRMPVLYSGVLLFTIAGTVCAASPSIEVMLVARFVQGIGASVGIVVARAIVRDIASGAQAARLLSIMVMIFTVVPMLAPIAGSYLVALGGWRAPFVAVVVFGVVMMLGVSLGLQETRRPMRDRSLMGQLKVSITEFLSHRQSMLGALLLMLAAGGFMSVITGSSALIIEIYGYPVERFGWIFAVAAVSLLLGSTANRHLLLSHTPMQVMGYGAALIGVAAAQMLLIAWLDAAAFWWVWGNVSLYLFGAGLLMPNATAMALDPLPGTAGVAASIAGTAQNLAAAGSSAVGSMLYDGSLRFVVINMAVCGVAVFAAFMLRDRILAGRPLYVADVDTG